MSQKTKYGNNQLRWRLLALVLAWFWHVLPAVAVSLELAPQAGLMQQPSSNYYLLVFGGEFQVSNDKRSLLANAGFFERPVFKANGFEDQEGGWYLQIGSQAAKLPWATTVTVAAGYCKIDGYVRKTPSEENADASEDLRSNRYQISGPIFSIKTEWRWRMLQASLSHQLVVGISNKDDLDARVAWPFQFVKVGLGVVW